MGVLSPLSFLLGKFGITFHSFILDCLPRFRIDLRPVFFVADHGGIRDHAPGRSLGSASLPVFAQFRSRVLRNFQYLLNGFRVLR